MGLKPRNEDVDEVTRQASRLIDAVLMAGLKSYYHDDGWYTIRIMKARRTKKAK